MQTCEYSWFASENKGKRRIKKKGLPLLLTSHSFHFLYSAAPKLLQQFSHASLSSWVLKHYASSALPSSLTLFLKDNSPFPHVFSGLPCSLLMSCVEIHTFILIRRLGKEHKHFLCINYRYCFCRSYPISNCANTHTTNSQVPSLSF